MAWSVRKKNIDIKSRAEDTGVLREKTLGYWESRKHMLYYKAVFQFICVAGFEAKNIIDIGSKNAEYIQWAGWIPERVVLDLSIPNPPNSVEVIEADFLSFQVGERYDVGMCCQVLEHLEDPVAFCNKLKEVCKRLIISVPYKWRGGAPGHIQDPVDEKKVESWMNLTPNNTQIVVEPFRESRLINYYDLENGPTYRFDKSFVFHAIAERAGYARIA